MTNLLIFIPKTAENNVIKFKKNSKINKKLKKSNDLLSEEIEIMEDMIANVELANLNEIEHECDDGFVITKNGLVKWNPKFKDTYLYVNSKKEQNRLMFLNERRKNTLKLVK